MVAGVVAMEHLNSERTEFINELGVILREGLQDVLAEQGLVGKITGRGSLAGIHLTPEPVKDYRGFASVPRALRELLHLACLNKGLFISPEGMMNTSTAMTVKDVHQSIEAVQEAFVILRPAIEAQWPHILR